MPPATHADLMAELRSMKGLIEERFSALAFMEKLQRQPRRGAPDAKAARLRLLAGADQQAGRRPDRPTPATRPPGRHRSWSATCAPAKPTPAIEDQGGVFALIGATGVGKTTTTAKIAAAFAARHGAANLGLITLDAYRVGAHEQLRAYGRILGVPVHTAHDRASLDDLLELLGGQEDGADRHRRHGAARQPHPRAARHARRTARSSACWSSTPRRRARRSRTCCVAYRAASCAGVVLRKIDEAVKLGPALDAAIRHKLKIVGVANGQRVPEDWHRLSAQRAGAAGDARRRQRRLALRRRAT